MTPREFRDAVAAALSDLPIEVELLESSREERAEIGGPQHMLRCTFVHADTAYFDRFNLPVDVHAAAVRLTSTEVRVSYLAIVEGGAP